MCIPLGKYNIAYISIVFLLSIIYKITTSEKNSEFMGYTHIYYVLNIFVLLKNP